MGGLVTVTHVWTLMNVLLCLSVQWVLPNHAVTTVNAPILTVHTPAHVRRVIPAMDSLVKTLMNALMLILVLMFQTVPVLTTMDLSHAHVTADGPRRTDCAKMLMNVLSQSVKTTPLALTFQVSTPASVTLVSSTSVQQLTTPVSAKTSTNVTLVSPNVAPTHTVSTVSDHMTVHVTLVSKTMVMVALTSLSALLTNHHAM